MSSFGYGEELKPYTKMNPKLTKPQLEQHGVGGDS